MIENLHIDHVLDLSTPEDRQRLCEVAKDHPELLSLIEEYLDEYLRFFSEPDWRKIYSGGMLPVQASKKHLVGFDLMQVLKLTRALRKLTGYSGFDTLMAGFRNPAQIESTYFEAVVAGWCAGRAVSLSMDFSPEVVVKGKSKYPEFLWHTELGSVYCECKKGNFLESRFHRNLAKLQLYLREIYEQYRPWDTSLRLDVRFERGTTNKIYSRFKSVVAQASAALKAGTYKNQIFRKDDVSAALRRRDEPIPQESEIIHASMAEVGPVAQSLPEATYLSLTMSLAKYRQETVARLLQDARTQLPTGSVSLVFIELGGASAAAQQKLQTRLGGPAYKNTPWVSIWGQGEIAFAVWRNEQPFDDKLLAKT